MTTEKVYFGTYTRRTSKGIYSADFDRETGKLSNLLLEVAEPSPTYLAFAENGQLYSVGAQGSKGGAAAFDSDFSPLNHVVEEGAPLCYIAVDEERGLVYGSNYHKGQVLVYKRQTDGKLTLADTVQHQGSGPHENQATPHVHYADLTPDKYLVTCDLGTDEVTTYDISDEGKLTQLASYKAAPGAGARHIIFHPLFKVAYLMCELNSTIEVLIYDGVGSFECMQTISTLPADYSDFNGTAAIRLSPDGRFVYGSNRGHDSIAVYRVIGDGELELIEHALTLGKNPRDFNLTPDGRHLIAVHQDSDNATVFKRDTETGRLTELSHDFTVPEAVCVTFFHK